MPTLAVSSRSTIPVWAPLLLGLAALYLPSFYRYGSSLWQNEEAAHAPIVIGLSLWLLWQHAPRAPDRQGAGPAVWALLGFGLLLYLVGRTQLVAMLEIGSIIVVMTATIALVFGWEAVRKLRFPLLFPLFAIPLPGPLVDRMTGPLKIWVSYISETTLASFGLPVARQGVILQVGQYQLLVADACSGLSSIFSLTALGLFYLYLIKPKHAWRRWALLIAVFPIAIIANAVRVMVLMLITYFMGDEAGQGFLHGFAGMTLFLVALLLLLAADAVFNAIDRRRS